jgi:hypothetical protein
MGSLDHLNDLLSRSGKLLDEAAREVANVQLNPEQNVKKIAQVLMAIFEIRLEIFQQRPDLKPEYLEK